METASSYFQQLVHLVSWVYSTYILLHGFNHSSNSLIVPTILTHRTFSFNFPPANGIQYFILQTIIKWFRKMPTQHNLESWLPRVSFTQSRSLIWE
jgi:hypothetical protein